MAESGSPTLTRGKPDDASAERWATSNLFAFCLWLNAAHERAFLPPDSLKRCRREEALAALRVWAEAEPQAAATAILTFAGDRFGSAQLAAGLLLQADLRPDDRIWVEGAEPDWLPQALAATQGRVMAPALATVLIADRLPQTLPPNLHRLILTVDFVVALPEDITVSRAGDWLWPA